MFFWKLNYLFFFIPSLPLVQITLQEISFFPLRPFVCQADWYRHLGSSSLPPQPASWMDGAAEALTSVYTPPPETKSYSVAPADLEFVIVFLPRPPKC